MTEPAPTPAPSEDRPPSADRAARVELVVLGAIVAAMAVIALLARRSGHWWGDDWALYVRQAQGLLELRTGEVIADNRFTVERSGLPEFSPPVYPWGYSIVLAPFVAVLGADLDRLAIAQIACFAWFLVMWHRLARPRVGAVPALLATAVLALSPQYMRWTELIQSELAFVAVALTAMVVLDRERTRATIVTVGTSVWPLVGVGAMAAAAFSVRREGLAVLAAVAAAQMAALGAWWQARRGDPETSSPPPWRPLIGRLATPYAAMAAIVGGMQLVLPSTLVPRYEGNGVHNVWGFASDHLGHVLESIGLKDVAVDAPTVFGNTAVGRFVVLLFLVAFAAGVVRAAWRRPVADLPLVAFAAAALVIGGSFRFPGSRYLAVVGPIALILAIGGARWLVEGRLIRRGSMAVAATAVVPGLLVLMAMGNAARVHDLVSAARAFERAGQIEWGPDAPAAVAMFEAVSALTDDDAVVGFQKARAMTQRTDRRALQVADTHPIDRVDDSLTHVVVERGTGLAVAVSRLPTQYEPIWANERFVLYARN